MADRCDECMNRVGDGVTPHAEDCPKRAPELLEDLENVREQRDHALEILKAALKQSMCDGDLCAHSWHEDARAAIRENDPDWVA